MAAWNVDNVRELYGLFAIFQFQGHGVIGMANSDFTAHQYRHRTHCEWMVKMRPELIPEKRLLLAFLQVKKQKDEN